MLIINYLKFLFLNSFHLLKASIFADFLEDVNMKIVLVITFILLSFLGYNQSDTIHIKEVIVSTNRVPTLYRESARVVSIIKKKEIQNAPVNNVEALLESVLQVDVRQRGNNGVQADLSIRGGSFEQTLILLNGVNISDAQTGHHNLDLPIDIADIEKIEILEGAGARLYGTNAFSGAINIITHQDSTKRLNATLEVGQNEYVKASMGMSTAVKKTRHSFSTSYKTSSGYIENTDFKLLNAYYNFKITKKKMDIDFQSGITDKGFGANSFYTPKFPNQFEKTNTFFTNLQIRTKGKLKLISNIFWRRHQDRFELFRNDAAIWYSGHNYHLTHAYGINSSVRLHSRLGFTSLGFGFRQDKIWSNVLGEALAESMAVPFEEEVFYSKFATRSNGNLFIEQNYSYKNFFLSSGISANWNIKFGWNFSPGIDLSYQIRKSSRIFASINHAVRLPSFTDLYYEGPTNIGNPNLKAEKAISIETGVKYLKDTWSGHIAVFRRYGSDVIDWVKVSESAKWQTQNITKLTTSGIEFSVKRKFKNGFVRSNYAYLFTQKNEQSFISKYALDYLKHKAVLVVQHRVYKHFHASLQAIVQDRAGSFNFYQEGNSTELEYPAFSLFDTKLSWQKEYIKVYLDVNNIFNTTYYDIGNIVMPGRWIRIGFTMIL